ncbi:hypothetical protein AX15_007410 [Amanita polypyramis BW_CC]|nr:hypothetical protein AX15_007410 [Amanita polypyramis BW_CC]
MDRLHLLTLASLVSFALGLSIPEHTRRLLLTRLTSLTSFALETLQQTYRLLLASLVYLTSLVLKLEIPQHIRRLLADFNSLTAATTTTTTTPTPEIPPSLTSIAHQIGLFLFYQTCHSCVASVQRFVDMCVVASVHGDHAWAWYRGEFGQGDLGGTGAAGVAGTGSHFEPRNPSATTATATTTGLTDNNFDDGGISLSDVIERISLIDVPLGYRYVRAFLNGMSVLFLMLMYLPLNTYIIFPIVIVAMFIHFKVCIKLNMFEAINKARLGDTPGVFW